MAGHDSIVGGVAGSAVLDGVVFGGVGGMAVCEQLVVGVGTGVDMFVVLSSLLSVVGGTPSLPHTSLPLTTCPLCCQSGETRA